MPTKKCPYCKKEYNTLYLHDCEKGPVSFGWGYFWISGGILINIILIGFLIYGFYSGTEPPLKYFSNEAMNLITIGISISCIIGLLKRKKWGLYLVYVIIGRSVLSPIINIIKGTEPLIPGAISLFIGYLWLAYFYRRRYWFK